MDKKFYLVDVFTAKKYAGNQLAVFRNAGFIDSQEMQAIARETNFSETTFILSDEKRDDGYDVRIFTPHEEVPFAGHPTLGTAFIIRRELVQKPINRINLNLKVGQIPVFFKDDPAILQMKQIQPKFGKNYQSSDLAPILSLKSDEIDNQFSIQEVSTGIPFLIVPLKARESLKKASIDRNAFFRFIQNTWAKSIMVFCPQGHEPGIDLGVRVFADYYGIPEDPATGSANGCLAGYLVKHRYFGTPHIDIQTSQGYEIGRPSQLYLQATESSTGIDIYVGGQVVRVGEGVFI